MSSKLTRSVAPLALAAALVLPAGALALPSLKAGSALDPDGGHGTAPRAVASATAANPGGAGSALDPDGAALK